LDDGSTDQLHHPDEHPQDLRGCLAFFVRATGCILWLYITMFTAILLAAIISLLFYR